jgi:hypothetical protein
MLRTIMAEIGVSEPTQHHAIIREQASGADLRICGPARGAIGHDILGFPCPPHRHGDRADNRNKAAGGGDRCAFEKGARRIGVERKPPPEEGRRRIKLQFPNHEPGIAELRLIAEPPGCPLRRRPRRGDYNREDNKNLIPKDLGRGHVVSSVSKSHDFMSNDRDATSPKMR